jgi:hypothetical protein
MSRPSGFLIAALLLNGVTLAWAGSDDLPSGPVQGKVRTACTECHDAHIIVQQRLSKGTWIKEVDKMIKWGTVIEAGDRDAFIDYLSTNFPVDKPAYLADRTVAKKK